MSFDVHHTLKAIKLYGLLLVFAFIVAVLQPQKLVSLLLAGDGAWGGWTEHIGADLGMNILAVLIVTAIAYFLDVFEVRQALPRR